MISQSTNLRRAPSLFEDKDKTSIKDQIHKTPEDVEWKWHLCDFVLREDNNGEMIFSSLKPSVTLVSSKMQEEPININLKIHMDRQFEFSKDAGWTWHKSWIIPTIRVSVSLPNNKKNIPTLPQNTYFQIRVVKASSKNPDKLFLLDLGIQGISTISASTGIGIFQGLKFIETSYKNDGTKFSLVISLKYDEPGTFHPEIIQSVISPPIFIDSRRTARSAKTKKECGGKFDFQDFNPSRLTEILVKRVKDSEEQITNSAQGVINYFTAPNIRNKIKNPFFLGIRFNKAIRLFYNIKIIQNKNDIMKMVMKRINQTFIEDQVKSKKQRKIVEGINEKTVLCVKVFGDQVFVKQILNKLQNNNVLQFYDEKQELPPYFQEIGLGVLKSEYEQYYNQGQDKSQTDEVQKSTISKKQHLILRPIPYRPSINSSEDHKLPNILASNSPMTASFRDVISVSYGCKQVQLITTCDDKIQKQAVYSRMDSGYKFKVRQQ